MNRVEVEDAKDIVKAVKRASGKLKRSQVVVCPPFVYTSLFSKLKAGTFFLERRMQIMKFSDHLLEKSVTQCFTNWEYVLLLLVTQREEKWEKQMNW